MTDDSGESVLVWTLVVMMVVAYAILFWAAFHWIAEHHVYARCVHIFHALERWAARH